MVDEKISEEYKQIRIDQNINPDDENENIKKISESNKYLIDDGNFINL